MHNAETNELNNRRQSAPVIFCSLCGTTCNFREFWIHYNFSDTANCSAFLDIRIRLRNAWWRKILWNINNQKFKAAIFPILLDFHYLNDNENPKNTCQSDTAHFRSRPTRASATNTQKKIVNAFLMNNSNQHFTTTWTAKWFIDSAHTHINKSCDISGRTWCSQFQ